MTYETCYEEAKKYNSKNQFKLNSKDAYKVSLKNHWIDDYYWLCHPNRKWTYETCYEEAKKYNSKVEFGKKASGAYAAALKNNWINDYTWFKRPQKEMKWTKEMCHQEALKYDRIIDFAYNSKAAYSAAHRHKWIKEITSHMKFYINKRYVSKEYVVYVYEDESNKVAYIGLTNNLKRRHNEHKRKINGKIDVVRKYFGENVNYPKVLLYGLNAEEASTKETEFFYKYLEDGWILLNNESRLGNLGSPVLKWDKDACYSAALKCDSLREFRKNYMGAYESSLEHKWLQNYTWFKKTKPKTKWSDENVCKEEAKKYSSIVEFQKKCNGAYHSALKNGWLKDYTWFTRPPQYNKKWTYETCREESMKYKTKIEFKRNAPGAYTVSCK